MSTTSWSRHPVSAIGNEPLGTFVIKAASSSRFVLWVDAVGGFLVCLKEKAVLGQAAPGNYADVLLLADLSRQHATLRRESEGYLIEPHREVRLAGRTI